jgi:hypothetical protein
MKLYVFILICCLFSGIVTLCGDSVDKLSYGLIWIALTAVLAGKIVNE